jgi:hypothetical protein
LAVSILCTIVFELANEGNEKPIAKSEVAFMKSLREGDCVILVSFKN